jgi:hypothetical protein
MESKKYIQNFGGRKALGKQPLVRPKRRWEVNIKMELEGNSL